MTNPRHSRSLDSGKVPTAAPCYNEGIFAITNPILLPHSLVVASTRCNTSQKVWILAFVITGYSSPTKSVWVKMVHVDIEDSKSDALYKNDLVVGHKGLG